MIVRNWISASSGSAFDSDALAYLNSAGITDPVIKDATDILFKKLKSINSYVPNWVNFSDLAQSKVKLIYPLRGGSEATMKWNAMKPLDSDAALRGVFAGSGAVLDSQGYKPSGTSYIDTKLNPSTHLSLTSTQAGFYSDEDISTGTNIDLGTRESPWDSELKIAVNQDGANVCGVWEIPSSNSILTRANNKSDGYISVHRFNADYFYIFRNGLVIQVKKNPVANWLPTSNIFLAARNSGGGAGQFSTRNHFFDLIGQTARNRKALDTQDAAILSFINSCNGTVVGQEGNISLWFGDSIIAGSYVTIPQRFATLVCSSKIWDEYNYGIPSSTLSYPSAGVNAVLNFYERYDFEIPYHKSNFKNLIIAYGVNDLIQGLDQATFESQLRTIVAHALGEKNWPTSKVKLINHYKTTYQSDAPKIALNARIASVATDYSLQLLDVWGAMVADGRGAELLQADGVHLSIIGNEVVANYIIANIT